MKKMYILLFAVLSSCGVGHPSGLDTTIKAGIEALKNSDCESIIKLGNPFDKTVSIDSCKETLMVTEKKNELRLLLEYGLNAQGELDESKTIYTIDTSKTGSSTKTLSFININGAWYFQ